MFHDWTVRFSVMDFSFSPGLSSCLHVMVYVFTKIIMTECTSLHKTLFMLSVVSQMKTIKNFYHMIYCRKFWYCFVNSSILLHLQYVLHTCNIHW
jgi:hypothetical protein